MKKNILTIIIMAVTLINTILLGVIVFSVVPTANKTNQLMAKVASIIDLELESPGKGAGKVEIADIVTYNIEDKLTINLKKDSDGKDHYAMMNVSLSMNSKNEDYERLSGKIAENENAIKEIISDEFGKYTKDEISLNKDAIKEQVITRIQELFQSDFVINVSFGSMVTS